MAILTVRHTQCMLLFWGITFMYAMRVNLSMALVAMTDQRSTNQNFPEYRWSEKVKSLLLSSFFWGYIFTQIPGGFLARKFGGKMSILCSVVLSSTAAILTPLAAEFGDWQMLFGIRVLQGLSQGVLFPTIHTILAKWAPEEERAAMGTYCYSGAQLGTVAMLAGSGYLAASPIGWPSIFYLSGGLGMLWAISWYLWGASSPSEHKSITAAERKFIETSLGQYDHQQKTQDVRQGGIVQHVKLPWRELLKSTPFWALICTHSAYSWGFWTMLTETPAYMKNILKMDIKSNALFTAMPYLFMFLLGFPFAAMASCFSKKSLMTLSQSRKFFNTLSQWIPAAALIWLGYLDADSTVLAVILITMAIGMTAAMHVGFEMNHIDLSPNFAGIMLGITNTIANIMSVIAPILVGVVVTDESNPSQWRTIFLIAGIFCFLGNLMFIIFGRVEVQPWNEIPVKVELKSLKEKSEANI